MTTVELFSNYRYSQGLTYFQLIGDLVTESIVSICVVGFQQQTQKNHSNHQHAAEHEITEKLHQSVKRSTLGFSGLSAVLWRRWEETVNALSGFVRLGSVLVVDCCVTNEHK